MNPWNDAELMHITLTCFSYHDAIPSTCHATGYEKQEI